MKEKKCKNCQKLFKTYRDTQLFCSKDCFGLYSRIERTEIECENVNCNNKFEIYKNSKSKQRRFCSNKCQNEWQKTYQLGERNGNYGRKNSWGTHPTERRIEMSKKTKESWKSPDRLKKHLDFLEKHRLPDGSFDFQNEDFRNKISKDNIERLIENPAYNAYSNCKSGYYTSTKTNDDEYYQSSWELETMRKLDEDAHIKYWTKKHGHVVKYVSGKYTKRYLPDFLIERIDNSFTILEIKGYIKDEDIGIFKLKCIAALKYFKSVDVDYVIDFMYNSEMYSNLIEWFNIEKNKIYG